MDVNSVRMPILIQAWAGLSDVNVIGYDMRSPRIQQVLPVGVSSIKTDR